MPARVFSRQNSRKDNAQTSNSTGIYMTEEIRNNLQSQSADLNRRLAAHKLESDQDPPHSGLADYRKY